ncbi:MAG TPA: nuclear transport factor 2 family protein [Dehalococcoidia bacterium]|nr:nuclear transport factor 2 family protein [Dehalococcoidia bacterium]
MQDNAADQVRELGRRWADAEQRNDTAALDGLLTPDFKAFGPRGFVLDRQQWLDRLRSGDLVMRSLTLDEVEVRAHGMMAIAIGRESQQAAYRGGPADGQFRVTQIAIRDGDRWLLAGCTSAPSPAASESNQARHRAGVPRHGE